MEIGLNFINNWFQALPEHLKKRSKTDEMQSWAKHHSLPPELSDFLNSYTTNKYLSFGVEQYQGILKASEIIEYNEDYPEGFQEGLLIVGSTINGDNIVIDFKINKGVTGYLNHEEMGVESPRDIFVPMAPSIGEFIEYANEDRDFPVDYYLAKDNPKYNKNF